MVQHCPGADLPSKIGFKRAIREIFINLAERLVPSHRHSPARL